jgi:hypothetical protein
MGLKELVLCVIGLSTATAMASEPSTLCSSECVFPDILLCTQGTKDIRPRVKTHGDDEALVESYFIKVGEKRENAYFQHLSYVPDAKVIAFTGFKRGRISATIDLYLDFAPYGSIDEVYHIKKNLFMAAKFGLMDFPKMLAEGKKKGDPINYLKGKLKPYRIDKPDMPAAQAAYEGAIQRAIAEVCVGQTRIVANEKEK